MSVSLSTNESLPGDPVRVRVRGERGACVCVASVDKSLYLLKPAFQLSPDKVGLLDLLSGLSPLLLQSARFGRSARCVREVYWSVDLIRPFGRRRYSRCVLCAFWRVGV